MFNARFAGWKNDARVTDLLVPVKSMKVAMQSSEGARFFYSQSTSRVTSIAENEMNIRSPLCNVRHLHGMLNISLEIFPKRRINDH